MEGEEPERALVPSLGPRWGRQPGCKCAVLKQAPSSHPYLMGSPDAESCLRLERSMLQSENKAPSHLLPPSRLPPWAPCPTQPHPQAWRPGRPFNRQPAASTLPQPHLGGLY